VQHWQGFPGDFNRWNSIPGRLRLHLCGRKPVLSEPPLTSTTQQASAYVHVTKWSLSFSPYAAFQPFLLPGRKRFLSMIVKECKGPLKIGVLWCRSL